MSFAELILLVALGVGIYLLLRPLQRWVEKKLRAALDRRRPQNWRDRVIDVDSFSSRRRPEPPKD